LAYFESLFGIYSVQLYRWSPVTEVTQYPFVIMIISTPPSSFNSDLYLTIQYSLQVLVRVIMKVVRSTVKGVAVHYIDIDN